MQKTDYQTHVCLVSDQAIPNLVPVLDKRFAPQRVVLVVSNKKMHERAEGLCNVFASHNVETIIRPLQSQDDFEMIRQDFKRIAQDYPDAVLNATGGKKTMTLAAYEAFLEANLPVFYVETDNTLRWLTPTTGVETLQTSISLQDMLGAYQYQIKSQDKKLITQAQSELAAYFFQNMTTLPHFLTRLEFVGQENEKRIVRKDKAAFSQKDTEILNKIKGYGILSGSQGMWLTSAKGAKFLSGEWLEIHVFNTVGSIAHELGIKDLTCGLNICSVNNTDVGNEIDVAFIYANHLYLIECKAIYRNKNKPMADFIYTLESLKKHGGLTTRSALLTWGSEPGPTDRKRAELNNIRVLSGRTLDNLATALTLWIRSV